MWRGEAFIRRLSYARAHLAVVKVRNSWSGRRDWSSPRRGTVVKNGKDAFRDNEEVSTLSEWSTGDITEDWNSMGYSLDEPSPPKDLSLN